MCVESSGRAVWIGEFIPNCLCACGRVMHAGWAGVVRRAARAREKGNRPRRARLTARFRPLRASFDPCRGSRNPAPVPSGGLGAANAGGG